MYKWTFPAWDGVCLKWKGTGDCMDELVSIIIPLYNAQAYVRRTLDSLLNQTYQNFEIIVVDDASTDGSYKAVSQINDARIRLFANEANRGIAYTRNKALSYARGSYIALMDDDDLSPPNRLEKELDYFQSHKGIDIVTGHLVDIDEEDRECSPVVYTRLNPKYLRARQLLSNSIPNGATMVRKEFILEKGIRYRENMQGAKDYRFWAECLVKGAKIGIIDQTLLYYRRHGSNASVLAMKNNNLARKEVIREIQKYTLDGMGFSLSCEQYAILFKAFQEEKVALNDTGEIRSLYYALREIQGQAEGMRLDNAPEIGIMCRKRFGEKMENAFFLWN